MNYMLCVMLALSSLCSYAVECISFDGGGNPFTAETQSSSLSPTEKSLADVQMVYQNLEVIRELYQNFHATDGTSKVSVEERIALLTSVGERIRPACARLSQLEPDKLKQICLLADAIDWQWDWVRVMCLSETGVDAGEPAMRGFENVAHLSDMLSRQLHHSDTSKEEKAALYDFLSIFGGETSLALPRRMLDERLAKDYKTAYAFFNDFTAAVMLDDDAECITRLRDLEPVLDYLLQGGESDYLRVNSLALIYMVTKFSSLADYSYEEVAKHLPCRVYKTLSARQNGESSPRDAALQPFFEKLPILDSFFVNFMQ